MKELDALNRNIIDQLQRDGRMSNSDLADAVGLSPSACLRRVQRLEKTGIISGYRALLNRDALGTAITIYVTVGLKEHGSEESTAFEKAIIQAPEVTECHNVTGAVEYLLRIEVSDLKAYKKFHANTLGALSQVSSITSHICLDSPKDLRS